MIDGDHIREVREQPATPAEKLVHQVIDCRGRWVLPGLVDLHVHLREPGEEGKETIATGCAGGGGRRRHDRRRDAQHEAGERQRGRVARFVAARGREAGLRAACYPAGAITQGSQGEQLAEMGELKDAGCVCVTDDGRPVMNGGPDAPRARVRARPSTCR